MTAAKANPSSVANPLVADPSVANPFLVRDLMYRPGEMRERRREVVNPDYLGEGLVSVPAGVLISEDLRLEAVHGGILVTAELNTRASGVCGRCLLDIDFPVHVEFQELFAYSSEDACEYVMQGDQLDLHPLVRDSVVLSLPFQPLCRADCHGLDPKTGERLDGVSRVAASEAAPEVMDRRC
jgi:uncharacterized protein